MYLQNDLFGDTTGSGRRCRALDDARMTAGIRLKMEDALPVKSRRISCFR